MRNKNKSQKGFTLIELLVVIAIIALLSSVALIAFMSARAKSRDAKRLSDMTQMNTGLALYFASNRGYPTSPNGIPSALVPNFASNIPQNPRPGDGICDSVTYDPPAPNGTSAGQYYYYPSGTLYLGTENVDVYPEYSYYFCLGDVTGNFSAGVHIMTPQGVR